MEGRTHRAGEIDAYFFMEVCTNILNSLALVHLRTHPTETLRSELNILPTCTTSRFPKRYALANISAED